MTPRTYRTPNVILRNLDPHTHTSLKASAAAHNRTMATQVELLDALLRRLATLDCADVQAEIARLDLQEKTA